MNNFSDTLTICLVLVLLFGSVALYLYTRIQQSEQKVSLLESILLDLKMSNEIKEYTELPADALEDFEDTSYTPYKNKDEDKSNVVLEVEYESLPDDAAKIYTLDKLDDTNAVSEENEDRSDKNDKHDKNDKNESKVNYDVMHLKDLQTLAKSKGITGVSKKGPLIEALKALDKDHDVTNGLVLGSVGSSSFLETSASFSNES